MFLKIVTILFLITAFVIFANGQDEKVKLGIVNGKLKSIPQIIYPEIAEKLCIGGKIEIEVEFMSKGGKTLMAKAISGDELLYESAITTVNQAEFSSMDDVPNVKQKGIVVLNFDSFVKKKCIDGGILNRKALNMPIPSIPSNHLKIKKETEIRVRVLVDSLNGKVVAAHAIMGHPIVRSVFETAAKTTTFSPFHHGQGIFVKGVLVYRIKADGTVEAKPKN